MLALTMRRVLEISFILLTLSILLGQVNGGVWHKHWARNSQNSQSNCAPQVVDAELQPTPSEKARTPDALRKIVEGTKNKLEQILDPLTVFTSTGKVKGFEDTSRQGKKFLKFYGIPFAKPPVGDLRFEAPQPVDKWGGVLEATKVPPKCAQLDVIGKKAFGQDDCLYLNVYTPMQEGFKKLLPVYAYIHGGAFHAGAGADQGGDFFMDHDVVVVNMNYRLGALGFMDTSDGVVKGNMGLKDQLMALKWIKKNIAGFGGDPNLVTIGGLSAGAMSVHYHLASPKSKGLFSKAILQSGSVLSVIGVNTHPDNYKLFVAKFNCTKNNDTKAEIDCLRKVDATTLVTEGHKDVSFPFPLTAETYFTPTVEAWKDEDSFLTEDPLKTFESGNYNKVPMLTGFAEQEMLLTSAALSGNEKELKEAATDFNNWAPKQLLYQKDDKISTKVKDFYYGGNSESITTGDNIRKTSSLFSDRLFIYGTHKFAKIHSKNAPTFLYYNAFTPDFSLAEVLKTSNQSFSGNAHGDDAALLHPLAGEAGKLKEGSRLYNLSMDLVDLYSQFLNEDWMNFRTVPWWQVNPNKESMIYLKVDEVPDMVEGPFNDRMKFWESLEGEIKDIRW